MSTHTPLQMNIHTLKKDTHTKTWKHEVEAVKEAADSRNNSTAGILKA